MERIKKTFGQLGALSLRTQLVLLTGLLLALAISVTSLVAISALRGQMTNQIDDEMRSNTPALVSYMITNRELPSDGPLIRFQAYLLDDNGAILNSITSIRSDDSTPTITDWNAETVSKYSGSGITVDSQSGATQWRVMPMRVKAGGTEYSVLVATPLTQMNASATLVALLTLTFGLATLFASIALSWVMVTRTFEPLAQVERTAARIAAGDLTQRMNNYNPYTEIGHLSVSLNKMLSQIEKAFDAQKRSEVKMRRFVGDASHELRTPLVSIRGYSELYRQGALPNEEAVASAMSRIEAESKRMGQLVEDLLTLARIDERRETENRQVSLLSIATDASNDAFATAPDREVEVVGLQDGAEPTEALVYGDEMRLRQVVANLMTNALRYTPEGSPLEIAVGTSVQDDGTRLAEVQVRDHGPGIHGEERQRVFERFYRADTSRTRETGGTGLGLSIVAGIVEQHDGSVEILETPGGGATFALRFPLCEKA
ncbi:sensor histidine kinase [Rothia aerolata]|uniref:histidine kinase n=1 Tax=Rothia aerolata TaxID=1812262 RepID=A0A917IS04_9MICC|nr:HAMP domain-containing sensor histidine kinase [Rothia aerolata]GGH61534.1 two-component sensor histidine kinase [Rothia aerolata]